MLLAGKARKGKETKRKEQDQEKERRGSRKERTRDGRKGREREDRKGKKRKGTGREGTGKEINGMAEGGNERNVREPGSNEVLAIRMFACPEAKSVGYSSVLLVRLQESVAYSNGLRFLPDFWS